MQQRLNGVILNLAFGVTIFRHDNAPVKYEG
jgi:hypothetical protein